MQSLSDRKPDALKAVIEDRIVKASYKQGLTHRQTQILVQLAHGETRKSAGLNLKISTHTVDYHIWQVYKVFGTNSIPEILAQLLVSWGSL